MLTFIGLGLYDVTDISLKGLALVREADAVFLETYTSRMMGSTLQEMEALFHTSIEPVDRECIEQHPGVILDAAAEGQAVLLTGGDPMVSTTHADLRIRAARRGIGTRIVHGSSIVTAVCGLSGLQNYRFGKSCSLPFPARGWFPTAPFATVSANLRADLHTLIFLDIQDGRCMTVGEGIAILEEMAARSNASPPERYVGIGRAGSKDPCVVAGGSTRLRSVDFGPPLHVLIVPATLHPVEEEYLELFAGL